MQVSTAIEQKEVMNLKECGQGLEGGKGREKGN